MLVAGTADHAARVARAEDVGHGGRGGRALAQRNHRHRPAAVRRRRRARLEFRLRLDKNGVAAMLMQQGITDPSGANTKWAAVDKAVTDQAPWVSMFNPKYLNFVSKRVKGFQFSPQWYFLIDQASVK